MTTSFSIGDKLVGNGHPTFIIAEVAQAHDGSLGSAYSFIDIASDSGVDAIKFQTHIANEESTEEDKFRVNFSKQDRNRFDYWKRMEFSYSQWLGLSEYAKSKNLVFLSSAFSKAAVDLMDDLVPVWKVGSGEFKSFDLIDRMIETKKPILLSTGMSDWDEIRNMFEYVNKSNENIALLQCTSEYPTKLENIGLNVIDEIKECFKCVTGLSDHSGIVWPSVAAIARGIDIVEVHITLHDKAFGPDVSSSLTPDKLHTLVEARNAIFKMNSHCVNKDLMSIDLTGTRSLFTKSVAPVYNLNAGDELLPGMLTLKKPGTGIPLSEMNSLYGKRLNKDVSSDRLLKYSDIN